MILYRYTFSMALLILASSWSNAQFLPSEYFYSQSNGGKVHFYDYDMDGFEDIVFSRQDNLYPNVNEKKLWWKKNNGLGKFGSSQQIISQDLRIRDFRIFDIDQDGDQDVLLLDKISDSYSLHVNQGDGNFTNRGVIIEYVPTTHFLDAHDFDNDGYLDFICSYFNNESGAHIYLSNSDYTYSFAIPATAYPYGSHRHKIIDLNRDGLMDLVASARNRISFWEGKGDGTFENRRTLKQYYNNEYASGFDFGDMDGDGDLDLVAGLYVYNLFVYENVGDEVYGEGEYVEFSATHAQPIFADIDLDGDLDLYVDNKTGTSNIPKTACNWYENYGNGDFGKKQELFSNEDNIGSIFAMDVDQDGDKDLIGLTSGPQYRIRKNVYNNPYIESRIFIDANSNNVLDSDEDILTDNVLNIEPVPTAIVYLEEEKTFRYYLNQDTYKITPDSNLCFGSINGQEEIIQVIDSIENFYYDIGLNSNSDRIDFQSFLTSDRTRCGFEVDFKLMVKNIGCNKSNAKVSIVQSDFASLLEVMPSPASQSGDTLWWELEDISINEKVNIQLKYKIAGADSIGEIIKIPVETYAYENGVGELTNVHSSFFTSEIRCAYDPNDKAVQPQRNDNNFTLRSEDLLYKIRFQNTGNDTAFTVELRDVISPHLDPYSIKFIDASHAYVSKYSPIDNLLSIRFDNILLPDSTTDLQGSQGFISFTIDKVDGIPTRTEINNKADIYLDYNPPIETNTTINTIVEEFACKDSIGHDGFTISPMFVETLDTHISCFGANDGMIRIIAKEGIGKYSINGLEQSVLTEISLPGGIYNYIISDGGNCLDTIQIELEEPDEIMVEFEVIQPSNDAMDNGSIEILDISGGFEPYEIEWSNGDAGDIITNLSDGTYKVTITDDNNCEKEYVFIDGIVSTHDNEISSQISISPNPSFDNFKIDFNGVKVTNLYILNHIGSKVFETNIEQHQDFYTIEDHLLNLPGLYLVAFRTEHQVFSKMLIKN